MTEPERTGPLDERLRQLTSTDTELVRELGLLDCTFLIMGGMIGSGIFLTTGGIATHLPSPGAILLVWLLGGVISLCGALAYAEMGAAMPRAGGQYVYLREAYGLLPAFLFGWAAFAVIQSGSVAAIAVGFGEYLGYFVPGLAMERRLWSASLPGWTFTLTAGKLSAAAAILLLTWVNYCGIRKGSRVQNVFTWVKVGALSVLVAAGLTFGTGSPRHWTAPGSLPAGTGLWAAFGIALIPVLWTYDGWYYITFVSSEVRNPRRNIPVSLVLGTLLVTVLYMATNLVYLYALPVERMSGVVRIAEEAAATLFSPTAGMLISAAVLCSTFGAMNALVLGGPRIYYAMARDSLFFSRVAAVHPRFKTPAFSIVLQGAWAVALTLSGTYDQLFTYVMFANFVFYAAAVSAVMVLRRKYPDLPRPYRAWGYPILPLLFVFVAVAFLINTLMERPMESLIGTGIVLAGIPAFVYWRRKERARENGAARRFL